VNVSLNLPLAVAGGQSTDLEVFGSTVTIGTVAGSDRRGVSWGSRAWRGRRGGRENLEISPLH
jgi:hypothetical protein